MQSPYYQNANLFKPSQSTLFNWLKTRKSESETKPGFFETVNFSTDQVWAIISILIELSALLLTLYGAWLRFISKHQIGILITAALIVMLFIAFDIIGILLHGYDRKDKTILLM